MYVEQYAASSCFSKSRFLVVFPWCDVDGVHWQSVDAESPTSFALSSLLRYKKSYPLSNRRLVRHLLRIASSNCCNGCSTPPGIVYSNLEMWL